MYLGKEASIAQWIHLRLSALKSEHVRTPSYANFHWSHRARSTEADITKRGWLY